MNDVAIPAHREVQVNSSAADFCPNNHILVDRDLFQHMQHIVREHHRIMPAIIIHEALNLGLINKEDSFGSISKVEEYIARTEDKQFYRLFNEYIERNPDKGFNFKFPVDSSETYELPPIL